jgi:hypothetical protein
LEQAGEAAQGVAGEQEVRAMPRYKVRHQVERLAGGERAAVEPEESNGNSDVEAKGLTRVKKREKKRVRARGGRR